MSRLRRDESGSSLVLALAFILATGLGIGALLSFLHAGFGAGSAVSDQGRDLYAADAAIEETVARLRMDKTLGVAGAPCGPFVSTWNGRAVTVECTPVGDSRQTYSVGGTTPAGVPAGALVALGTGPLEVRNNSSRTLSIAGDVLSNGPVVVSNGSVAVGGAVRAPACSGSGPLVTTQNPPSPLTCDTSTPSPATDPGWDLGNVAQPPTVTTLPGSHCNGAPVPAGTYVSSVIWNSLTAGCNGTLTFSGIYYLDFLEPSSCDGGLARPQWCVHNANVTLRAGTVSGTTCSGGALFVLGGTTAITVRAGTLALCGVAPVAGGPSFSIYAKSPPTPPLPAPTTGTVTLVPTVAKSTGNPSYASETHALTINGVVANASDTNGGNNPATKTATITLSSPNGSVPPTATITKVTARIAHRETTTGGATITGLSATVSGGTSVTRPVLPRTTLGTDTIDVTGSISSPSQAASATIRFEATGAMPKNGGFTSQLDGIELVIEYTLPPVVPPTPWGTLACGAPPCTVLDTDGANTRTSFHGTIYTPTSWVRVQPVNDGAAAFTRGIVAGRIDLQVPASLSAASHHEITLPGPVGATTKQRNGLVMLAARIAGDPRVRVSTEVSLPDATVPTTASVSKWTVR